MSACFRGFLITLVVVCFLPSHVQAADPPVKNSVAGNWIGQMIQTGDNASFLMEVTFTEAAGSSQISGTLNFTHSDGVTTETYTVEGTWDGANIQFAESEGRCFWGSMQQDGSLQGSVGWGCDPGAAWGTWTMGQGQAMPAGLSDASFVDLADGSVIQATVNPATNLPEVVTPVEMTGAATVIALDADELQVNYALRDSTVDPFQAQLLWNPWHGNGKYVLTLRAASWDSGSVFDTEQIVVDVEGIPPDLPTLQQRFIQLYQDNFGLQLTSPAFARYTRPSAEAVDYPQWFSAAYIGSTLYTIALFDNGFAGAMSYEIGGSNGYCWPTGHYQALVVVVNYNNTNILADQAQSMTENALYEGLAQANQRWADMSANLGQSEPLLQLDIQTAYLNAPPNPGQFLTPADIVSLTGHDPAQFDLLIEADLDANNQTAGQYGGLGISLNGGCLPNGPDRINIGMGVPDLDFVDNGMAASIFEHEFMHAMGWMHVWPNGGGSTLDWLNTRDFWLPTRLFGWIDLDGDGIIEILDPSPYGLTR